MKDHQRAVERSRSFPPIVVAIQQPTSRTGAPLDLSAASAFGRVEILTANDRQIMAPALFQGTVRTRLRKLLFRPEVDFIIPVGDYTAVFFVGMVIGSIFPGGVQILRWIPEARAYQPLPLVVPINGFDPHQGVHHVEEVNGNR